MRRVVITLGVVAILVSSCGQDDPPARLEAKLQERVASIRDLAEAGRPGLARARLETLVTSVTSRLDRGLIDEGWAMEILESAEAVEVQLRLLPAPSATSVAPSPSPTQEEQAAGGEGEGNGDGKDKDKGKNDEDHGKDD